LLQPKQIKERLLGTLKRVRVVSEKELMNYCWDYIMEP
jgi:hypothetical protein